ncbi:MAG: DUF2723 domain-containing protein [Chloroflexota bacterium]
MKDEGGGGSHAADDRRRPEGGRASRQRSALSQNLDILILASALFVAGLTLYLTTLAPSVVTLFDDSLEFQLVTYRLGIAHPTGYPLYTLLGKLFTFLPVGNVAYRVNLMSAVFGAATVALLYLLILQTVAPEKGRPNVFGAPGWPVHLGAIFGAGLLGVGRVFWQQSTVAEVYTLNAFLVTLLLLVATCCPHRLGWLAFLFGLSLTHHRTTLLLLPALGFYLYLAHRSQLFRPRVLVSGVALGLLPLLLYLYLPLRGHAGSLDGTYENTWAGFWRQVSAGGYGLFIFDNPFGHERDAAFYWQLLVEQFYTTAPGWIGLVYLLRLGRRRLLALTGLAFLTYLTFNLFYNVTDIEVFFIPNFLIWAVWSGVGAAFLLQTAATLKFRAWRPAGAGLLLALFAFMIFQLLLTQRAVISRQYTWQVHDEGLDMLAQPLPPERSAVVGILGEMTLLRYFQQTEQRRPDVETVAADREPERLAAVEELLSQGKTVYLTRQLPGASERWSLNAVGPLIRVDPRPVVTPPAFSVEVYRPVLPDISLLGYNVSRPPQTGPGRAPVRLTLFWQAAAPLTTALKVSARLLNQAGEEVVAVDAAPVHFAYPTTAWRPGEIISDVYDLALPADTPAGQFRPRLIWYDPAQNAAEVGRIELPPLVIE